MIYALEADGFSYAELKDYADDVRQQLLRVPDVAKVELFGVQDEKIFIEISQKRLAQLGLRPQPGAGAARRSRTRSSRPARCRRRSTSCRCASAGQFQAVEQLRAMPIRGASGNQLRLGDIAEVKRGYVDPPQVKVRHDGKEVIALGVSMAKGGDIIQLGKALQARHGPDRRQLPAGIELVQVQDQPRAVAQLGQRIRAHAGRGGRDRAGGELHQRWACTSARAPLPLWRWYVDMRPGLVVAITIPLVLAITFLAMYYWGIGLHKISLGSLIIALGLLVDDAIIAVEMMVRKMEEGYDKVRAATFAYEVDRDADADRHADHRGRLPADRHGAVDGRRIHLRDLRGDGRSRW